MSLFTLYESDSGLLSYHRDQLRKGSTEFNYIEILIEFALDITN